MFTMPELDPSDRLAGAMAKSLPMAVSLLATGVMIDTSGPLGWYESSDLAGSFLRSA